MKVQKYKKSQYAGIFSGKGSKKIFRSKTEKISVKQVSLRFIY